MDLALATFELESWAGNMVDPVTSHPVVILNSSFVARYVVRNRGSVHTAAATLSVCQLRNPSPAPLALPCAIAVAEPVDIPPLAPGESAAGTFAGEIYGWQFQSDTTLMLAGVLASTAADDVAENDVATIASVLIGGPRPFLHLEAPAVSRIGDSIQFVVRIENRSRLAGVAVDTLVYCMVDNDTAFCPRVGFLRDMAIRAFAGLPPRGSDVDTTRVWLEPAFMGVFEDLPWENTLWTACLIEARACSASLMRVLPDLDLACGAGMIALDTPVTGTTDDDCGLWMVDDNAVFSFDAVAGAHYRVELTAHSDTRARIAVITRDGERIVEYAPSPATFTAPADGRYHILVGDAGTFTLLLSTD